MTDWTRYDTWNRVLASKLLGPERADQPAYLECEDSVLESCAVELGLCVDGARQDLIDTVRSTLELGPGAQPLATHASRFHQWRREFISSSGPRGKRSVSDEAAPPFVALLTTLVMAAERMGADGSMAANAYYPRLGQLFDLDPQATSRLRSRFPVTERFWAGLNEYLAAHEGQRGLDTAYSLGHRYVGIPQSQAVVRAADRERLPRFFRRFGLTPGSELVAADLERLLDAWIGQVPTPVTQNLSRLWQDKKARDRVAGVVAVELAHWDGVITSVDTDGLGGGELALTALVRQQFGQRSLDLSFAARFASPDAITSLTIVSNEDKLDVGVVPAAGGRLRPTPGTRLDGASLLSAVVELEDPASAERVKRHPRRVVPLRRDDLLGLMVEIDKVQLTEDVLLLVKDEPGLVSDTRALLDDHGRHGAVYAATETNDFPGLPGLPDGWLLFDDVQLFGIPQEVKRLDLQVLVPLTTAQLTFAGGLKLPGRIRKWSSQFVPEIRAAVAEAETLTLTLTQLGEEATELEVWSADAPAIVVPLSDLNLDDGDYEVELAANGESLAVRTLRLRSGDTPDQISWETCMSLNYELDRSAVAALSAIESNGESSRLVDGLGTLGVQTPPVEPTPVPDGVFWSSQKGTSSTVREPVILGVADPKACVVTGAHYFELPTYHGGKSKGQIDGVCKKCGLRKSYPARPKWSKVAKGASATVDPHQFVSLKTNAGLEASWDVCLDALVHVGGGNIGSLERIASQAQGSSLFVDNFLRTLETAGHIDVQRDSASQPAAWEANPAYLAETFGNGFVLAGVWSPSTRILLRSAVEAAGGELVRERHGDDGLSCWFVRGLDSGDLEQALDGASFSSYVAEDAAAEMIRVLPPLSDVIEAMPKVTLPMSSKQAIFDLAGATWRQVPGIATPGAYRLEQSFRTTTVFLDREGAVAPERWCRVAGTQMVKHMAAHAAQHPLLGYSEEHQLLLVPLGADLPGIYGRAAALCSGMPPMVSLKTRSIAYSNVPRWAAETFHALLSS